MRRPCWHRALSAVLAVWFALVTVEPAALHACPMHSGGHAGARAHADSEGQQADHAGHQAVAGAPDSQAPSSGHSCTCLGDCSGTLVARVPEGHVALVALLAPPKVAPGRPQHEFVAAWVDFVLPFATAPPTPRAA
jgi:hypothetical protein